MRARVIAFGLSVLGMLAASAFGSRTAVILATLIGIGCWLVVACWLLEEANLPPGPFTTADFPDRANCRSTALTDALRRREEKMLARWRRDCKRLGQRTGRAAAVHAAPDRGGQAA